MDGIIVGGGDNTFAFVHRDSEDVFFFHAPAQQHSHMMQPYNRQHALNFSTMSIAPPVSLHNRSFGAHRRGNSTADRRNDSNSSASLMAFSYAMHVALAEVLSAEGPSLQ